MISANVFILTFDWQDINGKNVLRFQGTTEDHRSVEIVIDNVRPVFFIDRSVEQSELNFRHERKNLEMRCFQGNLVDALYFRTQRELKLASEELFRRNITTFESDLDPARRFLMERFINVQMQVTGEPEVRGEVLVFINPKIKPCDYYPELSLLSMDIETGRNNTILYSIAIHYTMGEEEKKAVFLLGKSSEPLPDYVETFSSEKEVIEAFLKYFKGCDPDIIIGWHVIGFDLMFIEERCKQLKIPFDLSRCTGKMVFGTRRMGGYFSSIPGRVVIDGPPALRSSFYSFEDFRLETVAQELLKTGKTITPEQDKLKEIEYLFNNDKRKFAEYNLQDCILVTDIFKKTGLIDLSIKRAKISGLLLDELGMMTLAFDHFYLPHIHRKGYVAPDLRNIDVSRQSPGGYVIEPKPGIYENVVVLDFKSLYPSIIRTFKIGPLSYVLAKENPVTTPGGYKFSKNTHFLADFIGELMERRTEAKKKGDRHLSQAIKILMNSFYGVMGSSGCRFYKADLASAITTTGHWLLLGSKEFFENIGYEVIYGDTDSLFVKLKEEENNNLSMVGESLAARLNKYWQKRLSEDFNTESCLEIEFEKVYTRFTINPARGGDYGAKKRYAGLIEKDSYREIEFVGMEFVRSDWTKLAKDFQEELYKRVFNNLDVKIWIQDFVAKVKNGEFNDKLIYKKRLRKDTEDYIKNVPPHVKAARLINRTNGTVYYVITKRGPIPVELEHNDFDYNHYIDKQIKPIADSLLNLLGISFDSLFQSEQLNFFN
ncbi:MAG: DNA polymerase II [Clostridiales bacterium]